MPLFCNQVQITRPPPPPPPEPGVPEDEFPPASPKPAAVSLKFTPELNIAFQVPPCLKYPSVIVFHAPPILTNAWKTISTNRVYGKIYNVK